MVATQIHVHVQMHSLESMVHVCGCKSNWSLQVLEGLPQDCSVVSCQLEFQCEQSVVS